MSIRKHAFRVCLAAMLVLPTGGALVAESPSSVVPNTPAVIFDTDMGSDCDDAGALAVLHALADAGEVRILGVIFSSGKNRYGVGTCDAINTYYGRGDLPLGQYKGTDVGDPKDSYTKRIATDTKAFRHDIVDEAPDLVSVYRTILQSQPDHSVTIVTVGHPHGLVHLMRDRRAAELVRAKVDRWVAMGMGGWNFQQVGMSAYSEELLKKWPMPFYISPSGVDVKTGHRRLPKTPETNPVREAYRLWNTALVDGRSSWDQVAVLSLLRPKLFKLEHRGHVERTPEGRVVWNPDVDNPNHHLVTPRIPAEEMARIIEELMARPPKARVVAGQGRAE
ncbi:MAG: nucleoside hydrolase [Candidatus Nealsonbacteria bacterium]|nr:nucleoside hydrolase [Candidatus Nealsonbacteria bacterium]